ncbi:TVP38/TMEM64 family protein [Archangium lansingense]|uniref:TVP38/TMEM64 family membrane protein n=1 Tax=Archangium lansingense TaxID=2995310 RepID=A0ABT4A0P5_9BACT|nr:TVP38/TMEM64 family protein [Archangium lansinium]MCY1075225.1 TVP38/TMEM64 family protein [Archangium lansinium]
MARGIGRWAAAVAAVTALVLAITLLPVDTWLLGLVERIRGMGMAGAVLYVVVYVVATVLMMPASVLTMGAGFVYGPVYGSLLVMVASNLSAQASFLLGRTVLHERVGHRLAREPRFTAVDTAVAGQGFKVVLLLRLSPVLPFSVLNYSLSLTRVRLRDYGPATFLGLLPATVLYVYLGSLVTSVAQLSRGERPDAGPAGQLLFWGGLAATVLVTVYVTHLARRALNATLKGTST